MELSVGDKIRYKDVNGDSFRALIIEIWKNDDGEITGYFSVTNSGLYVHFHASSLEWVRLEEQVPVP